MTPAPAERRAFFVPGLLTIVGLAILIGLGTWQLERRAWKHELIARLADRLAQTPRPLPPLQDWTKLTPAEDEFRRVTLRATFAPAQEAFVYTSGSALRPDVSGAGYWILAPARLTGGDTVLVNRGFVPEAKRDPESRTASPSTPVEITGVLRWPEERNLFTPADQPDKNLWFTRDPLAIAGTKGWGNVAPFYIEQETANAGGWPKAGPVAPRLSNNHLQYAITWFALAAGLAAVFAFWARGQMRLSR
ncbi:MAG: hypothetical protein QOD74_840 [Variibacter sp.]|nr:hypothetical protein [Variibacter sp.]